MIERTKIEELHIDIAENCGKVEYILHSLEDLISTVEFPDNRHYPGESAADFLLEGIKREMNGILNKLEEAEHQEMGKSIQE